MAIIDRFWHRGYTERQALITAERDKGRTYRSIADEYALSPERIRQIVTKVHRRRKCGVCARHRELEANR